MCVSRRDKGERKAGREIERLHFVGAAGVAGERPRLEAVPMIFAGVVNEHRWGIGFRRAVF